MSLEGKQEKIICEFIPCPGIGRSLKMSNCNEDCDHYGGIQEKPITDFMTKETIRVDRYVLCKYPNLLQIHTLCDMEN